MSLSLAASGDLRDGWSLSMVTGLVSNVVDGLGLAVFLGEGVEATNNNDSVRFFLFVQNFLYFSGLLSINPIFSFEAEKYRFEC